MVKQPNKQLNKTWIAALGIVALVLVIGLAWYVAKPNQSRQEVPEATTSPERTYVLTQEDRDELDVAVKQAYLAEKGQTDKPLEVVTPKQGSGWVYGSVGEERSQFTVIFLAELQDGAWVVGLGGSDEFYDMAQRAPDSVVSPSLKKAFETERDQEQ